MCCSSREPMTMSLMTFFGERKTILSCLSITNPMAGTQKRRMSPQNREAFLWNHFFGGEPLLSPPTSSYEVIGDKLKIHVRFENGPQAESGRIWWMYDRAPVGSAPFLYEPIPEDQWADMERDPKTGSWIATIPLEEGASRIDFFSNHGKVVNGYQQYLSSPYTRVEFRP